MKMASRNIASMHLFLEMKTKFPYLPEDTLRNYVLLYAQDQAKCISMLQKENENRLHPSQHFTDIHPTENKLNFKVNENIKENTNSIIDAVPFQASKNLSTNNSNLRNNNFYLQDSSNCTNDGSIKHSNVDLQITQSSKLMSHSAPIIRNSERPFMSIYQSVPNSSQNVWKPATIEQTHHNRMMFSTTKEHIIESTDASVDLKSSQPSPTSNNMNSSKRHAVKLSITPVLPFQQQQLNVYSNTVSASTCHSSKPGRHTTSLNFQLQPQSSNQFPLEISTVPTGTGKQSNYRDFGSHVQVSVGAQGATFTALRLQRPSYTQSQNVDSSNKFLPGETHANPSNPSSQVFNSKTGVYPTSSNRKPSSVQKLSLNLPQQQGIVNHSNYKKNSVEQTGFCSHKDFQSQQNIMKESSTSINYPSYQASPDYIQAVKKHQRAQLSLVQEELNKAKSISSNLKSEVNRIGKELLKRKENTNSSTYAEVIKKLKEENRQLRLECSCLLMEYDMCSKGVPVGCTDEDFYSNIFTGPNDGLALSQSGKNISEAKSSSQEVLDEDDEKNAWKCKKCTFVNHPALEKCEICEISKNAGSFFDDS